MKKILLFAFMAATALTVSSCVFDRDDCQPVEETGKAYLTVKVGDLKVTRATPTAQDAAEQNLKTVDLFVYEVASGDSAPTDAAPVVNGHQRLTVAGAAATTLSTYGNSGYDFDLTMDKKYTVVAIGNAQKTFVGTETIATLRAETATLSGQIYAQTPSDGEFVMYKEITTDALVRGYNSVGEGVEAGKSSIIGSVAYMSVCQDFQLERRVAKVIMNANVATGITGNLTLTNMYLLNANSKTNMNSTFAMTANATYSDNIYVMGKKPEYMVTGQTAVDLTGDRYPGWNATTKYTPYQNETANQILSQLTTASFTDETLLEKNYKRSTFYTFPNTQAYDVENHSYITYAVVEGTWNDGTNTATVFYPVAINVENVGTSYDGGTRGAIEPNTVYNIILDITGKGSSNPWAKDDATYMSVRVSVADWASQIDQTVEW